jgi:signal peptidase I
VNRRTLGCLFELAETFLLALVFFMVLQLFVAQPYQVQQESMENTVMPGQYVIVDKLSPRFDDYHRLDIIVFSPPSTWQQDASATPYIKRVIGLPGDTVEVHDNFVYVNGIRLVEPYVFENQPTELPSGGSQSWTLAQDQFFVMGDHRAESQDSRQFGPIDRSSIIGRAWMRYWPFDKAGLLPQYQPPAIPNGSPAASGR